MQVHIDSVSDVKVGQYGPSSKIKCGNESYFTNEDATPLVGKTVDITVETKTSVKGNTYKIAKIVKVLDGVPATQPSSNGQGVRWVDYVTMARLAHEVATELEPDVDSAPVNEGDNTSKVEHYLDVKAEGRQDRSTARIAFVNTVLIAFTNGKIALGEGEDEESIPF
jgi:hypothetical protein